MRSNKANDDKKKEFNDFLTPTPNYKNENLEEMTNRVRGIADQYKNVEKQLEQMKALPQTNLSSMNSNLFYENLHPSTSNLFGGGIFNNPVSPAYHHPASINYYSVTYADNDTRIGSNPNVNDSKNLPMQQQNNLPNMNIDTSEGMTNAMASPKVYQEGASVYVRNTSNISLLTDIQPKLQNIVSTANLKCELDLREIALRAKNAEYNPKRFAAVIMRIREPKTTALIFASGKMVCTGARSEEDSKKAARQYAKIILKLGFPVKFSEFKIQNIVGSSDVRFPIRLEGLANAHSRFCSYEPEMFPGLIFRMIKPKIVLLIFVSGKIVLTGAKERNDIFQAFQNIYPVLMNFKKKEMGTQSTEMSMGALEG